MGNSDTDGTVVIEIRSFESRNPKKKVDNVWSLVNHFRN